MIFNWLDLVLVLVMVLSCYNAYKKGLLLTLYKLVSFVLAIGIAWAVHPVIETGLREFTNIETSIEASIVESFNNSGNNEIINSSAEAQFEFIEDFNLPESLKESMMEGFKESGVKFVDFIAGSIADFSIMALSFLLVIVVVFIILSLIQGIIKLISEMPVIESLDKYLGVAIGFIISLVQIWILFGIISLLSGIEWLAPMITVIKTSVIGGVLYEHNLLLMLISSFFSL